MLEPCKNYTGTEATGTLIADAYTDGSGNKYDAVVIGNLLIIDRNLLTTRFQDGTNLTYIMSNIDWWAPVNINPSTNQYEPTPGFCYYNFDTTYRDNYGYLYNHHAVHYYRTTYPGNAFIIGTSKYLVSGNGWRVTTKEDWEYIIAYLNTTNWCNEVTVPVSNAGQYLKSERQKDHPMAPFITVLPNTFNLTKTSHTGLYFDISSNYTGYFIETLEEWITIITTTGSNNTRIYFNVGDNTGVSPFQTTPRQGTIVVRHSGVIKATIYIYQDGDIL